MCFYKFENILIGSRVSGEKLVFDRYFEFSGRKWKQFFKTVYCSDHYNRTCLFNIRILKLSQFVFESLPKYDVSATIWIFLTKQEVFFSNLYILLITTIELENMPLKFWKYPNLFSSYSQKRFSASICIFHMKPEVDLWNLYLLLSTTIDL